VAEVEKEIVSELSTLRCKVLNIVSNVRGTTFLSVVLLGQSHTPCQLAKATAKQREERLIEGEVFAVTGGGGDWTQIRRHQRTLSILKHIPFAIRRMYECSVL
jgi:hypothetical protein